MTLIYSASSMAFLMALLGLVLFRKYLLSALICLEGMLLSMFVALSMWSIQAESFIMSATPIMTLTLSACEAGAGLAILVAISRSHGSTQVDSTTLLKS